MLKNPDIAPTASINRWIVSILMFHFDLVHVPSSFHGPDGLSRRKRQPEDLPDEDDDFEDWIDQVQGFPHIILPLSACNFEQPPSMIHILSSFTNSVRPRTQEDNPEDEDEDTDPEQETQEDA